MGHVNQGVKVSPEWAPPPELARWLLSNTADLIPPLYMHSKRDIRMNWKCLILLMLLNQCNVIVRPLYLLSLLYGVAAPHTGGLALSPNSGVSFQLLVSADCVRWQVTARVTRLLSLM